MQWKSGVAPARRVGESWRNLGAALVLAALHAAACAETWIVGPQKPLMPLAEAITRASDGDVIALMPGEYRGHAAVLDGRKLTLRGIGKRPVFVAEGKLAENKAILVLRNGEYTIENVEFRGARAPDANGAGVRFESGKLTVQRSAFFDNETGILTGNDNGAELAIEDSEFGLAPRVEGGLHHLLYVGRIARLAVRGSRFHTGFEGHLIKSRAAENRITYNLIHDGDEGQASYEIDLPSGGVAWLIGNVIGQGPGTRNPVMVAYGSEGRHWPRNALYVAHNTFVGQPWPPGWALRVFGDRMSEGLEVRAVNNLTIGLTVFSPGTKGDFAGNHWAARRRTLSSVWTLEFDLPHDSPLRGTGVDPGIGGGEPLAPSAQFKLPAGTQPTKRPPAWSPGAYQD